MINGDDFINGGLINGTGVLYVRVSGKGMGKAPLVPIFVDKQARIARADRRARIVTVDRDLRIRR